FLLLCETGLHVFDLVGHLHELGRVADAAAHELLLSRPEPGAMVLAHLVRLAQPAGDLVLPGPGRSQRVLALDDCWIRLEPRLGGRDRFAECALSIYQRLIAEQELG